ncbi:hypothetical protein, partial [Sphingomonas sp. DC1200-1]|uniref:hypothetical protein n=1 Tax=Sphingomonas sp. DC1200-1 TaxID=2804660 RepID=UPI003CF86BAF
PREHLQRPGKQAIKRARVDGETGGKGFDLHVAHTNLRARALYLKLGFRDIDPPLDFHQRMMWSAC